MAENYEQRFNTAKGVKLSGAEVASMDAKLRAHMAAHPLPPASAAPAPVAPLALKVLPLVLGLGLVGVVALQALRPKAGVPTSAPLTATSSQAVDVDGSKKQDKPNDTAADTSAKDTPAASATSTKATTTTHEPIEDQPVPPAYQSTTSAKSVDSTTSTKVLQSR